MRFFIEKSQPPNQDDMNSSVVCDITQTKWISFTNWSGIAFFTVLACIALVTIIRYHRKALDGRTSRSLGKKISSAFAYVLLVYCLTLTTSLAWEAYTDHAKLRSAYEYGQCEMVEGIITDYKAAKAEKNAKAESFFVGNKIFTGSGSGNIAALKAASDQNRPIKNGLHVRINHCGNDIARLEIIDDMKPQN